VAFLFNKQAEMKKNFLVIAFAFIGIFTAQAQWYIGGGVKASFVNETQSFTLAPDAGYCFENAPLSLGCAVEYGGTFRSGEAYSHSLTVSPYLRYSICDIGERFSFFTDLTTDIDALELSWFNIGLSPGVTFDLTDHWSAEFSAGFLGYEWEREGDNKPVQKFVLNFETVAPSFRFYYSF